MKYKLFLIVTFVGFFIFACGNGEKIKQGNEIAAKIEKFKTEKGRLPDSLSEIGVIDTESGPIYYKKENESKYILWFGKELGESMTFDSDTRQWK